jgi:hypothetical protein
MNTQDSQIMNREGVFWLMALELPVHDWADPLLLGLWKSCHMAMVGVCGKEKLLSSWHGIKREQRGAGIQLVPQRQVTNDLKSSH